MQSFWCYEKYGVDFIREDGAWKIWHMHVFYMFRSPYDSWWTKSGPYQGFLLKETHCDRPVNRPIYNYSLDIIYPLDEPAPPNPYKSFDEVAPGFGYVIA